MLADGVERLAALQEKLYAQDRWAVLAIFQAMDAAGKDGAIKHVMSGVNPQGCQVHSFKAPSHEELDHDFLWRIAKALPERGRIGIFNRSHYEEVLVVRVHPEYLAAPAAARIARRQGYLGRALQEHPRLRAPSRAQRRADPQVLPARLEGGAAPALPRAARRAGEALEVRDGRRRRAQALGQVHARLRGGDPAYEPAEAPWYVVPADNKWFARLVIAEAMVEAMERPRARISEGRRCGAEGTGARARRADGGSAAREEAVDAAS